MTGFEVWPGPMEGVGRNEFVMAASALQLTGCWMTPFIRITESIPSAKKMFQSVSAYLASGLPVTVQLMGNDAAGLIKCALVLLEHPAVSGINLNMGCPSLRVVRHGAGGGLLKDHQKAVDLASALGDALPAGKFSIKIRAGFSDPDEMEELLPALSNSGNISKIFFHYRTVEENYSPAALIYRESRILRAVALCGDVPLIANGDIDSVDAAEKLVSQTGAAGVMIARPWMRDPYLLRRFQGDTTGIEAGQEHFFDQLQAHGVCKGALIEMARMLWGSRSERFRKIICQEMP